MRVSKKCEWALRAVFELALRDNEGPMKLCEIAAGQVIPEGYLKAILAELRWRGYVGVQRGRGGGYYLARSARRLTVGDVICAIQGTVFALARECAAGQGWEYVPGDYAFEDLWLNVGCAISEVVSRRSFAELVEYEKSRRSEGGREPRRRSR